MRPAWIRVGTGLFTAGALACTSPALDTTQALDVVADPLSAPNPVESIVATLYYASVEGPWLVPVQQEVPLANSALAQGRHILTAQLGEAPEGLTSVFPAETRLRGFYVTDREEAFVDLTPEVSMSHPGGALNEQLTVYAVVNAVTTNLPAIQRVQILINGREVDTLSGHVDLRRPLEADPSLVGDAHLD
jgi:spore germination protein GerM